MFRMLGVYGILLAGCAGVTAQSRAEFDVASVKVVDISKLGDAITMNLGTVRREQVTFGNATLNDMVRFAYNLASDAQIVGPDWIRSKQFLYDVVARGAPGSSVMQLQEMMVPLLAERFGLSVHRDMKTMSYFALVAKSNRLEKVLELPEDAMGVTRRGHIERVLAMPKLGYLLSRFETERPIIDETGLPGLYRVKLAWDETAGPSLATALSEQLGLKLEARKGPVEIIVVDRAQKVPVGN